MVRLRRTRIEPALVGVLPIPVDLGLPSTGRYRDAWYRFCSNRGAFIASWTLLLLVLFCLIYPIVSPYDPNEVKLTEQYQTPNLEHPAGTDQLGRDLLTRVAVGGRLSLAIGFAATMTILLMGVLYGSIAGYRGGRLDNVMMRFLDALYGLPYLPFAIIALQLMGATFGSMIVALSIASWFTAARIVRGQVTSLKENDYVTAAHAIGAKGTRIVLHHVLPNTLGILVITVFLELPGVILGEAFLGFLGLGISPPQASWGAMAQDGYDAFRVYPYVIAVPSIAIATVVLCANFIADGLRDALDPRSRGE